MIWRLCGHCQGTYVDNGMTLVWTFAFVFDFWHIAIVTVCVLSVLPIEILSEGQNDPLSKNLMVKQPKLEGGGGGGGTTLK